MCVAFCAAVFLRFSCFQGCSQTRVTRNVQLTSAMVETCRMSWNSRSACDCCCSAGKLQSVSVLKVFFFFNVDCANPTHLWCDWRLPALSWSWSKQPARLIQSSTCYQNPFSFRLRQAKMSTKVPVYRLLKAEMYWDFSWVSFFKRISEIGLDVETTQRLQIY